MPEARRQLPREDEQRGKARHPYHSGVTAENRRLRPNSQTFTVSGRGKGLVAVFRGNTGRIALRHQDKRRSQRGTRTPKQRAQDWLSRQEEQQRTSGSVKPNATPRNIVEIAHYLYKKPRNEDKSNCVTPAPVVPLCSVCFLFAVSQVHTPRRNRTRKRDQDDNSPR